LRLFLDLGLALITGMALNYGKPSVFMTSCANFPPAQKWHLMLTAFTAQLLRT